MSSSSILFIFSQVKSASSLPKCPYAAVFLYIGLLRSSSFIMAPGLKSKVLAIAALIFSSDTIPVPNVSTSIDTGCATPIA